ncbi:diphosphate--fructose-6-phosphate 1-phosphotransferase [candidate division TA06 bacterium]|uniref:Pyrophosphate--fructose 6-phosphate 1-phosphotransferase n=1 Tax=candidate division TA06 bacterium TaxID=2250710 RepID=A0A933MJN9_UNCT6|nr:diphosphate--fructose-6-phosphate 1-phosphotransferase [candidate division TA06 bacterium]
MSEISVLQKHRAGYRPKLPKIFIQNGPRLRAVETGKQASQNEIISRAFPKSVAFKPVLFEPDQKRQYKPLNVGVIFSGGQAPGGHNVIAGLFDFLTTANPQSKLYGFLGGGGGLVDNKYQLLTSGLIDEYRNTGGFDLIRTGRTKLDQEEQFVKVAQNCRDLGITGLAIVGGDDSNTNACLLAEYFLRHEAEINVIGCPKTIDGDLKNGQIEISFGFDTATKVYTELLGNILRDCNSAQKYWHFVRVMGRSASHIALECALQCHPNLTIISEEVAAQNLSLKQIVEQIAGLVRDRAEERMNFGVVVVPEGLIEFIPEIKVLITELNEILSGHHEYFNFLPTTKDKHQFLNSKLSAASAQAYGQLPDELQWELLEDRDPHGNVQVSKIETEKLLIDMVGDLLREWKAEGKYRGKYAAQNHFFGYEGRCAAPSNFDADYAYSLGYTAGALLGAEKTGYIAMVKNLMKPSSEWVPGGQSLASMMAVERRHGQDVPVIKKALVELEGEPFKVFARQQDKWMLSADYIYPGPIQYFGPDEVCDRTTMTLVLEQGEEILHALSTVNALKDSDFFGRLAPDSLTKLLGMVQYLSVRPGQVVIRRGEIGQCFYVVMEGELEVLGGDDSSVVATLKKGDPFGEIALLADVPRTATVAARTEGDLIFINNYDFKDFLAEHPELEKNLSELSQARLAELKEKGN